ncbi:MAG: aminotransferase class I/II-fold pyridoxal phosphate-dependent enzyme [Pseudomonadales bacterium]|jgi:DNA-binding transcriptional MocR family regulator|nr:aminotransferase class I/II-fold pyridoxal phosphate-dependent enzyme [Pseudomonadales bacterium]MDP6470966.1 aminotransferase class I/II-fold pyridoxal phosphate-dependent enzyme [Pseudomonadales bacterium]MDP6825849.1 aminotransferase class I/II-fold pyridoxal phosphate-dependent enzyme [Pseudomonadales bacterium]MDP6972816.1 aminotransferase class I/II-fold pyridoxal phosphate-dependent enzyme [Pseudomonadales bacterium]|tara:strand:- start:2293 stop:3582 length:1290 start_codon:yes stop_codon:yes gene_type:complete
MKLDQYSREALEKLNSELTQHLELAQGNRMALDLSRGKPAPDQLDLAAPLDQPLQSYIASDGTDARNYGSLRGLPEARALGADLTGVPAENLIATGNSSLFLMYIASQTALNQGLWGDKRRWSRTATPKFLTPVPGYDRHFTMSETLGIEMINIPMTDSGPDMARAEELVRQDPDIKGIWCVPKYANPTGCIYSPETVQRMAMLPATSAADDFVVFWDNAYAAHDFTFPRAPLTDLYQAALEAGTEDHVLLFGSTSKITYASGGVSFVGASDSVLDTLEKHLSVMLIGPDKVSQLRHARFLGGRLEEHMAEHAKLLTPKFDLVEQILSTELGDLDIASWTHPSGGYFVSLDVTPGTATEIIDTAREAGLALTPAGATFPYGRDPDDKNIRIAPTFATLEDLQLALELLTLCVKLVTARRLLEASADLEE